MEGLAGDTLASALYANGVRIFGRSLKYHRPRGLYSLDGESANTLVHVNRECNVRAETTPLVRGDAVSPQNTWGPVEKDRLGFMDRMDGFMPAGFYYRRFHKPVAAWPLVSRVIRKMAGTGVLDTHSTCDGDFRDCYPAADVCVIGGGPSGMAAALAAADTGKRVILLEIRPWLGGHFDWRVRPSGGKPLNEHARDLAARVTAHPGIRAFTRTALIDLSGDIQVTAFQTRDNGSGYDQSYIHIHPRAVVVATGAGERPMVFENNELPGVMQAGCAWRLARTWGVLPGKAAVFSVADDAGLEAAADLLDLGLEIRAVADARTSGQDEAMAETLARRSIPLLKGYMASAARPGNSASGKGVKQAILSRIGGSGAQRFGCDLVAVSAGLTPVAGPLNTVGAKIVYDHHTGCFMPRDLPFGVHVAGRLSGLHDPEALAASGRLAGLAAALDAGGNVSVRDIRAEKERLASLPGPARGVAPAFHPAIGNGRKSFVCFDEDGTVKSVRQSMEQGFDTPELAKRFGGFGLGPGQGGIPGHTLPLVMSQIQGRRQQDIVPTTTRSPLAPVLMGTVAGPNLLIRKYTPLYRRQNLPGTEFIRTGDWMRANRMSARKSLDANVADEVRAVRNRVALLDVSTLGKFRVFGPDALKALQRVYISDMGKVTADRLTYSAMLNTGGAPVDDGVVTRTGKTDYYLTTSSAWAGEAEAWIRYHTRYDNLDFHVVNLTDALAAVNLAGPDSLRVLAAVTPEGIADLPYMGYRETALNINGWEIPARFLRVGFLGERACELHFPAAFAETVWDALLAAGRAYDIRIIGLEAQNVCRMEKGHIILGLDSFQETTLTDLGLGFLWGNGDGTCDKVGAPALKFAKNLPARAKLAGLEISGGCPGDGAVLHKGDTIVGHICTARNSLTLDKTVAMAVVRAPLNKPGTELDVFQDEGGTGDRGERRFTARVVPLPFYDPDGKRLRDTVNPEGGE